MKNIITKSRRATPWDDLEEPDSLQLFLRDKYHANFDNKHIKISDTNESILLNSIQIKECRLCLSTNIIKYGHKDKVNRYYCKDCHKTFTITTNTIFENYKIPIEEWIEFCLNLFGFGSTTLTSKNNKIA